VPRSEAGPGPHPEPPSDLARRALPVRTRGGTWWRLHDARRDAVFFGRTGRNRFDAPGGAFGILYVAEDAEGAFIETLGRDTGRLLVDRADLARLALAEIVPPRPLRLVDLTGAGLVRIGADSRLVSGEHGVARRWSLALHAHPSRPDGLYYRVRHDPSRRGAAVFDRVGGRFRVRARGRLGARENAALLARLLDRYGFGLVET
jgi:hypothetical protein